MSIFYKNLKSLHRFICLDCNQPAVFLGKRTSIKYNNYYCQCGKLSISHFKFKNSGRFNCIFYIDNFQIEINCFIDQESNSYQYNTFIYKSDFSYLLNRNRYILVSHFNEFPDVFTTANSSDQVLSYLEILSNFL